MNSLLVTASPLEIGYTFFALIGVLLNIMALVDALINKAVIPYWSKNDERDELNEIAVGAIWSVIFRGAWHSFFMIVGALSALVPPNPNIAVYGVSAFLSVFFPSGMVILEILSVGRDVMEWRSRHKRIVFAKDRLALAAIAQATVKMIETPHDVQPSVIIQEETSAE